MRPAEQVALARGDRQRRRAAGGGGARIRVGNPGLAHRLADGGGVRSVDAHDRRQRDHTIGPSASKRAGWSVPASVAEGPLRPTRNSLAGAITEPAAAGALLANELESRGGMLGPLDDHVLQQVAEARLDGTLVAGVDVEIVGDRAHLADLAVGLREHRPRRVAEAGARRLELFERLQARLEPGELVLARAHRPRAPLVLDARAGQLGLPGRARQARRFDRRLRGRQRLGGGRPIQRDALRLDAHVVHLDVQLRQRLADAVARRRGVLHGMTQRRRRIDRGKTSLRAASTSASSPFDLAVRRLVRVGLGRQRRRALALRVGRGGRVAPRRQDPARRLAPRQRALRARPRRSSHAGRATAPARGRTQSAAAAG